MKPTNEVLNVLEACRVDGCKLFLPAQLERKLYVDVNKVLELCGGKWNRSAKCHLFGEDPTELIETVMLTGEITDAKKEFQFFQTPREVANQIVTMAEIGIGHSILEPSAGMGAIVKVFHEIHGTKRRIDCFELMEKNRVELTKLPAVNIVGNDFLLARGRYDRIIANPPFSKQQDVDHVNLMYGLLNAGGVLVSVMSPGWKFRENKKSQVPGSCQRDG